MGIPPGEGRLEELEGRLPRVCVGSETSASTGTATTVDRWQRCAGNSASTHLSADLVAGVLLRAARAGLGKMVKGPRVAVIKLPASPGEAHVGPQLLSRMIAKVCPWSRGARRSWRFLTKVLQVLLECL